MTKLPFTPSQLQKFLDNVVDNQLGSTIVLAALINDHLKTDSMQLEVSTRKGCFNTPVVGVRAVVVEQVFKRGQLSHGLQFEYNHPEHEAMQTQMMGPWTFAQLAPALNIGYPIPTGPEDLHKGNMLEGMAVMADTAWEAICGMYSLYMDAFLAIINRPFNLTPKVFWHLQPVFMQYDQQFPTANVYRVVAQLPPFIHECRLVDTIVERLDSPTGFSYKHSSELLTQAEYRDRFTQGRVNIQPRPAVEPNEWLIAVYQSIPTEWCRGIL